MTEKKKKKQRFARTISADLHKQWRLLQRNGDSEKLAAILNLSKPTIDKALIYGCVHQERIVETVTDYFMSRIGREKLQADQLQEASVTK